MVQCLPLQCPPQKHLPCNFSFFTVSSYNDPLNVSKNPWQHPSPNMIHPHHLESNAIFLDGVMRLCKFDFCDFCPDFELIYFFSCCLLMFCCQWIEKLNMTWQSHFNETAVFNLQFQIVKFDLHLCCRVLPFSSMMSLSVTPLSPNMSPSNISILQHDVSPNVCQWRLP